MRIYDSISKNYVDADLKISKDKGFYTVEKSQVKIPISYLRRHEDLLYLVEFLKCDGTISIIKRKDGLKGEIVLISTEPEYKEVLRRLLQRLFPSVKICERKDGFVVSSLALAVALASEYNVLTGKKEKEIQMICTEPKSLQEAKAIVAAVIDAEGNVDHYSGDIIIGNVHREYLQSLSEILENWFKIKTVEICPSYGWGMNYRFVITKEADVAKINFLRNPAKIQRIKFILSSSKELAKNKDYLKKQVLLLLSKRGPRTLNEFSDALSLAPFAVRKLVRTLKLRKVGVKRVNSRNLVLYEV